MHETCLHARFIKSLTDDFPERLDVALLLTSKQVMRSRVRCMCDLSESLCNCHQVAECGWLATLLDLSHIRQTYYLEKIHVCCMYSAASDHHSFGFVVVGVRFSWDGSVLVFITEPILLFDGLPLLA